MFSFIQIVGSWTLGWNIVLDFQCKRAGNGHVKKTSRCTMLWKNYACGAEYRKLSIWFKNHQNMCCAKKTNIFKPFISYLQIYICIYWYIYSHPIYTYIQQYYWRTMRHYLKLAAMTDYMYMTGICFYAIHRYAVIHL